LSTMEPTGKNALIIFIKAPLLGEIKTRLQPELLPEASLKIFKAMGKDLVDHFSRSEYFDLFIQYWPANALVEMRSWLGMNINYLPQRGLDLGEKLKSAFSDSLRRSYQKVCIIGSDLPTIAEPDILEAIEKLNSFDVILGPAIDGGYFLVALKEFHPQIFENIDWSTHAVFEQTMLRIAEQKLSAYRMAVQRDIDTYDDVMYLWNKIKENENNLERKIPNTVAVLKEILAES
jgi:rSAM/selenodomain-associated transferase 1